MKGIFVTGTDTGIGKTFFSLACIQSLQQAGIKTTAMKPVASGANMIDGALRNEDALLIQQALNHNVDYSLINPYVFMAPISPHIAARKAGLEVDLQVIQSTYQQLCSEVDFAIVEGVGGWLAPLSDRLTVADMAIVIGLPVVMVVGLRLGCLNHARLTAQAIERSGLSLAGWVANGVDPELEEIDEQIDYLSQSLGQGPLAKFGWQEKAMLSADSLRKLGS